MRFWCYDFIEYGTKELDRKSPAMLGGEACENEAYGADMAFPYPSHIAWELAMGFDNKSLILE